MSSVSGVGSALPFDTSSTTQNKTSAKGNAAVAGSGKSSTSNTTNTDSALTSSVGSTFMNLLVKELQNQDPTAPMDSTAMVGQMISLNQLDQLMSINQDLSSSPGGASIRGTGSSTTGSAGTMAARAALASPGFSTATASMSSSSNTNSVLDLSGLPLTNSNGAN